ncbi:MAG: hypothetical protein AAGE59_21460 [Cyanobacteria bacterium P01_F01_bin.86]
MTKQTSENISKCLYTGMLNQIAANRANIVIAVEESFNGDNLRFWLRH